MTPIRKVTNAIQKRLEGLGKTNGTAMPASSLNTESYAFQLYVAMTVKSFGDKLYKCAKEEAKQAGVITFEGRTPGDPPTIVFDGEHVAVTCQLRNPAKRIDHVKLKTLMRKSGMSEEQVSALMEAATVTNKPAEVVDVIPK